MPDPNSAAASMCALPASTARRLIACQRLTSGAADHKVLAWLCKSRGFTISAISGSKQSARPEVGPTDILVRVSACGICSGDIMPWYIRRKAPLVLGHEPVGVVEEVGFVPCRNSGPASGSSCTIMRRAFDCAPCRRGEYVQCATWRATNIDAWRHGRVFPGQRRQPARHSQAAGRDCRSRRGVGRTRRLRGQVAPPIGLKAGESVLIIGLGIMGMMHVKLARHLGAGTVIGADLFERRAQRAR